METTATVHIADLPISEAVRQLRRPPDRSRTPGLVHADVGAAAPLRRRSPLPVLQPRRVGVIAFWESRDAAHRWITSNADRPLGAGWHAVLEPLRAYGDWPGLPPGISRSRSTDYDGPSVVLTLGRVRLPHLGRFLRTSRPAERAAADDAGMAWGTALAHLPFVATCSLWTSTEHLEHYAYDDRADPHPAAIAEDRRKNFHHRSAFVRFKPLQVAGGLAGRNPLEADQASFSNAGASPSPSESTTPATPAEPSTR